MTLSLVEKGWAGARTISLKMAQRGIPVFHLVRGTLPRSVLKILSLPSGMILLGVPPQLYRLAAWCFLRGGQADLVIVDNPRALDWVARQFPRLRESILLVGETPTGQPEILRKGNRVDWP